MENTLGVIERLKDPVLLEQMTVGERLSAALIVMVLGLLTCIVVLALIMIVIKIMHRIMENSDAKAAGRTVSIVTSPLAGSVISVSAAAGKSAAKGDALLTVRGAAGDTVVCAPDGGNITEVKIKSGDSVSAGDALLVIQMNGKKAAV